MPEEMDSRKEGNNFMAGTRGIRKKRRMGILHLLGLQKLYREEEDEDDSPGMRYENTRFGGKTQKRNEASEGIGDVGEWHAEDQMMVELEKRAHKKLKRMEKEAGRPWGKGLYD